MTDIVCRLPVVESFVAVLNRSEDRSQKIRSEEEVEGSNWLYSKWRRGPVLHNQQLASMRGEIGSIHTSSSLTLEL